MEQFTEFKNTFIETLEVQGFPTDNIYIQGSAVHSETPDDIDIMIRLPEEDFNKLAKEFEASAYYEGRRKEIINGMNKGKLASYYAGTQPSIVQSLYESMGGDLTGDFSKIQVSFICEGRNYDLGPLFPIGDR